MSDEKPYGYDGKVQLRDGTLRSFHYVGRERAVRHKALLLRHAIQVVEINPVTKEEWLRAYGDPRSRM